MEFIFLPFAWLVFCILVGVYASSKGRSGIGFFLISAIFSPLIGIIIALIIMPDRKKVEENDLIRGDKKKCPKCSELIMAKAIICKHCRNEEFKVIENWTCVCGEINPHISKEKFQVCKKCGRNRDFVLKNINPENIYVNLKELSDQYHKGDKK